MADTRYLRNEVERYIRGKLADLYGQKFSAKFLKLVTGRDHEFDAVSDDGAIVASIKATSGLTARGKPPQGKFNNAIAELYYLTLVDAHHRLLILTNPKFPKLLVARTKGALNQSLSIICIGLPHEMQGKVDEVLRAASKEVSPVAAEAVAEAEST